MGNVVNLGDFWGILDQDQEDQRLPVGDNELLHLRRKVEWAGWRIPGKGKPNKKSFCRGFSRKHGLLLKRLWFPSLLHPHCK